MINLIPPSSKIKLRREYWVRVISVWFILWSIALFLGAVTLLPVYVLIGSQVSVYEDSTLVASHKTAGYENISSELVLAGVQARSIINIVDTPLFSEYMTLFDSLRGENIKINTIHLSREGVQVLPVTITGVADTRQALSLFRDSLLSEELVKEVDLPISNLAQDKDIIFTISIVLNNNNDI